MHRRARIRQAVAAALVPLPAFGGRVSTTRLRPTRTDELPCAIIYALRETSERSSLGKALMREATIQVEIRLKSSDALDDEADALALAVETALDADPGFGRLALDSSLSATNIGLDGEGDEAHAIVTLDYTIRYRTDPGAAGA